MDISANALLTVSPIMASVFKLMVWLIFLASIFIPLERRFPVHAKNNSRHDTGLNLTYYFINGLLSKMFIITPLSILVILLHGVFPNAFYFYMAQIPTFARLPIALIVGEVGAYWGHRWSHRNPILWRFHVIHHSAERLDWLVNTRAHPLDMAFGRLTGLVPVYVFGLAQPTANAIDPVPMLLVIMGTVWSYVVHSNIRWRSTILESLVTTPAFHHWHHTNDGADFLNKNFAPMFPVVDRIFGTHYLPEKDWPQRYGTDTFVSKRLKRQLLDPILPNRAEE